MYRPNRQDRRKLRKDAVRIAAAQAGSCYDYTPAGELKSIDHPEAVAALQRAFHRLLQEGGEPQVLRISATAGRGFPRYDSEAVPDGARPWLAVGFDVSGRATYCVEWVKIMGADPATERRMVEGIALARLRPQLALAGFPEEAAR